SPWAAPCSLTAGCLRVEPVCKLWNLLGWLRLCIGRDIDWSDRIATRAEVEAVFRSHGGLVWRAVLTMAAGDRDVADEATCEAFARLFANREGVRDPVAWVFRTAFRLASKESK